MVYNIDIKSWGRVFTVPCSVVDKYLKSSDGDFIKVLLCVLSIGDNGISTEKVSEICGVCENTVVKALGYWSSCGVLTASCKDDFIGFVPDNSDRSVNKENPLISHKSEIDRHSNNYYTPAQISEIIRSSDDLKSFFDEIQSVLGRILTNADQRGFIFIYEEYGYSPASITLITEYCKNIGKTTIAYIKSVAKSWFEQDIIGFEEIEKHIIKLNEYHSYENEIKRALGITIKLSSKQSEYISSWKSMGISAELCEYAYDRCVDATSKLSFGYINKILENWNSAGIKTVEQAKNGALSKKNYHKKEHSYDINEIDDFQKNFLLNRSKSKN